MHREKDAIEARGARLIFIGVGNRHFAQGFIAELGITAPLYVDTARNSYRALGMKRGIIATILAPGTWRNRGRARQAGFAMTGIKGDPWQLGGVLAVLPGGRIVYRYLSRTSGDHAPVADLLASLPPR